MSEIQYERDKVYLRDTRSGQIFIYERHLAQNKNFEAHVPNPSTVAENAENAENVVS